MAARLFELTAGEALAAALDAAVTVEGLHAVRCRLAGVVVFDPSCGDGALLVAAWCRLRELDRVAVARLHEMGARPERLSQPTVCGIEVDKRAAVAARVALTEVGCRDLQVVVADAIGTRAWGKLLPVLVDADRELVVVANPPFLGVSQQPAKTAARVRAITGSKMVDLAAAWLVRTADLVGARPGGRAGLIVTSSVYQGVQVPAVWPRVHAVGVGIEWAVQSTSWPGAASTHVALVGLRRAAEIGACRLYGAADAEPEVVASISPYLQPGPPAVVELRARPGTPEAPRVRRGCTATDAGHLIVKPSDMDRDELLADPLVRPYLRRYVGADQLLDGDHLWCLWLGETMPAGLAGHPLVVARVAQVRAHRRVSARPFTRQLADTSWRFESRYAVVDAAPMILMPRVSASGRRVIPARIATGVVPAHGVNVINGGLFEFGVLQSSTFTTWARTHCGRLGDQLAIGPKLINAYPWPEPTDEQRATIEACATRIIDQQADRPLRHLYPTNGTITDPQLALLHDQLDDTVAELR